VGALDDLATSTEQEEGTSAVCALRLTLCKTFIANESTLLIADKATNRNAGQSAICYISIDLRCGDDFR
jgi:hypothetical protein